MNRFPWKYKNIACFIFGFYLGYCIVHWLSVSILRQHVENCLKFNAISTPDVTLSLPEAKDNFLLVAVMTTRKYLKTRAEAIYRTWGQRVPGRIVFFVGGTAAYNGHLPVIILENITENAYPPQKKSFAMLKYVSTHFVDHYEWFMRSDDDVFVKTDRLEKLLRSINSSKTVYMGQPGTGTQEEAGKLGLHNSAPYCMGGPGVFFTRSTLRKISSHLSNCLLNAVTLHEDTEVGRCVQMHAGIACSNAFEFAQLFYQNYRNKTGSFTHKLGIAEERAITLHPIKDHPHMFRLDSYFCFSRLKHYKTIIIRLSSTMDALNNLINKKDVSKPKSSDVRKRLRQLDGWNETEKIKRKDRSHSRSLSEIESKSDIWDFIHNHNLYSRYNLFQSPFADLSNRGRGISYSRAKYFARKDSRYNNKDLTFCNFSYQRLSYGRVMESILPLENSGKASSTSVRTIEQVSSVEFREQENMKTISSTIWIILPLYRRSRAYASFVSTMINAIESFEGTVILCVVLYLDEDNEYIQSKQRSEFRHNKLKIKVQLVNEPFSRAKAITIGINHLKDDSLLLIMDVDMIFNAQFLNRVVVNTIINKQAYFPIYFSRYEPTIVCFEHKSCDIKECNFDNQYGTWRFFSYGIVSVYKGDLHRIKGFKVGIKGWGKEDVDFFEKCLKSHLNAFRATDPFLFHIYHKRDCDKSLPRDQLSMCIQSRNQLYGYERTLFKMSRKLKLLPV